MRVLILFALLFGAVLAQDCDADLDVSDVVEAPVTAVFARLYHFLEQLLDALLAQLQNQFMLGTMVVAVTGFLLTSFTLVMRQAWAWVRRRLFSTVRISDHMQMQWVLKWIAKHYPVQNEEVVELSLVVRDTGNKGPRGRSQNSLDLGADDPDRLPVFKPVENVTSLTIRYKRKRIVIKLVKNMKGNMDNGFIETYIQMHTFSRSKQWAVDLLSDAHQYHLDRSKSLTSIQMTKTFGSSSIRWVEAQARPSRPFDTVIFNNDEGLHILNDVKEFLDSKAWYYERGIPYRRGYLVYGPPGCGKTSFITALAGETKMTVCVVNLSDPALTDSSLLDLMATAPTPSIVLLEDIDAAFITKSRKEEDDSDDDPRPAHGRGRGGGRGGSTQIQQGLTFAGLLQALDGVNSQEGKVTFMSTNHREKLDEALIRPGRVDVQVKFSKATSDAASRLFRRFYRGVSEHDEVEKLSMEFKQHVPDSKWSMAQIQGHLMQFRKDPHGAVRAANRGLIGVTDIRDADKDAMPTSKIAFPPSIKLARSSSVPGKYLSDDPATRLGAAIAEGLVALADERSDMLRK